MADLVELDTVRVFLEDFEQVFVQVLEDKVQAIAFFEAFV